MERSLTIEKIINNAIPISALKQTLPFRDIAQALDIQLTRLVASLNLKYNLRDEQIKTIVEDLLDKYPHESLEDFTLVFKKARTGCFKDESGNATIYRLDSAVIFGWMALHLEEKYKALEDKLRDEKEDMYKPVKPVMQSEKHQDWLDRLKDAVKPIEQKKPAPLSDSDVVKEGQVKPKRKLYIPEDSGIVLKREQLKELSAMAYAHLKNASDFSSFKHYPIEGFEIFAASKEDAQEIYNKTVK